MALAHCTDIALPAHQQPGGFDHAAVHGASARLYVAHTANDARDVIDCATERYLHAIPNGLELDSARQRLFCACDVQRLVCLESYSGRVLAELELSGAPDMIMLNARSRHLYGCVPPFTHSVPH